MSSLVSSRPAHLLGLFVALATLGACDRRSPTDDVATSAEARPPVAPGDAEWRSIHGPRQDSTSPETGLNWDWPKAGPPVLWEKPVGRGYAVPVLADGRVVAYGRVGDEEVLECLKADDGGPLWRAAFPTAYKGDFEYSDGPYATPAIAGGAVFALSAEGTLRKVDLATGKPAWERTLAADYAAAPNAFAAGASPLVDEGRVVVNVGGTKGEGGAKGDSGIVAVDAETGRTLWTATDHGDSYATPRAATIGGDRYVFVLTDRALVALDPADGRVRWQTPFGLKGSRERVTAVSPLVVGDLVMVTAGPGAGALVVKVLPGDKFEQVWRDRRAIDSQFNNLTTDGRHVYGFTSMWNGQAELRCLDLSTGKVLWGWDSVLARGSSVLADGRLILLGEKGHLASVDASPDGPEVRFLSDKPLLEAPAFTAPALQDGRLYVRNEKRLLCLDLRPSRPGPRTAARTGP